MVGPAKMNHPAARFSEMYLNFDWGQNGNKESRSGSGSTIEYTQGLRNQLPEMLQKFEIKSMLDAPCGDMNWMSKFLDTYNIDYIGGDIVSKIVEDNQRIYPQYKFIELDITQDPLPKADLFFCRDCLFHLPNELIHKAIDNFLKSKIPYLFTTTHIDPKVYNQDISVGNFRFIDLFKEPFNFTNDVLYRIEDYQTGFPPREMILLKREQLL